MLQVIPFLLLSSTSVSTSGSTSVVGGTPAKPGAWRDAVAVLSPTAACTGTLITPDVVLTAGHCIDTGPAVVIVDTVDYGQPGGEPIKVKRSIAYPDWEHAYDVGLVVLDRPAAVKPRAIAATCSVRDGLVAGALVHLVGFGLTTKAGTGDNTRLHEAQIPIIDPTCGDEPSCVAAIEPDGELTAGGAGRDACFGDSGGPIYLDTPGGPALIGVVSRGFAMAGAPCGSGGVYVRADQVIPWIQRVTHETVVRSNCAGAADQDEAAPAAADAGGCAAGAGAGGTLVIALGALAAVGVFQRGRRGQRRVRAAQTA
jgi:secreted trypsin-like serine protease